MKRCEYCGLENEDEAGRCGGCWTIFPGAAVAPCGTAKNRNEPRQIGKALIVLGLLCALLAFGLFGRLFFAPPAGPGATISFSGYSTNRAGVRVAVFNLVSSNQHPVLYRAMSDPEWSRLLGSGPLTPFSPARFVQYGRLPAFSRMTFEVPVPAAGPPGRHYHLSFAYCQDAGRLGEQVHRFWRRWVLRWVPVKQEPFPPPGFRTRTTAGPEVEL